MLPDVLNEVANLHQPFLLLQKNSNDLNLLIGDHEIEIQSFSEFENRHKYVFACPYNQIYKKSEHCMGQAMETDPLRAFRVQHEIQLDKEGIKRLKLVLETFNNKQTTAHYNVLTNFNSTFGLDRNYERIIETIVSEEISKGQGSSFVIPRSFYVTYDEYLDSYSHLPTERLNKLISGKEIETGMDTITGNIQFTMSRLVGLFEKLISREVNGFYMNFLIYLPTSGMCLLGSSPERQFSLYSDTCIMNPISGTFSKNLTTPDNKTFSSKFQSFLTDKKEISELFMVTDEEIKMMCNICPRGGSVMGPMLKEMNSVIHTEYEILGDIITPDILSTDSDQKHTNLEELKRYAFELFESTMYCPTVVGSPITNAVRICTKYESTDRLFYSGALGVWDPIQYGKYKNNHSPTLLDSCILIRTLEYNLHNNLGKVSAGSTIVKDSVALDEVAEVNIKASSILSLDLDERQVSQESFLNADNLPNFVEIAKKRNSSLNNFWLHDQCIVKSEPSDALLPKCNILIVHNDDDFIYMIRHMLTKILNQKYISVPTMCHWSKLNEVECDLSLFNLVVIGPGPGDPSIQSEMQDQYSFRKISILLPFIEKLFTLNSHIKIFAVCLGHQAICRKIFNFDLLRKDVPTQGVQETSFSIRNSKDLINLNSVDSLCTFSSDEQLTNTLDIFGFYNSYVPVLANSVKSKSNCIQSFNLDSSLPAGTKIFGFLNTHGSIDIHLTVLPGRFVTCQYHPESILSRDGYEFMKDLVDVLDF